jgi:hypothetical protein
MRRTSTIAFALTGLMLGGGSTVLFAGDPPAPAAPAAPPAPAGQATEIEQRVEDLGSADFRVREAAMKALIAFGEKARPALEAARKSENPSVRFRSEQLLARLNGGVEEKPLDDGTPDARPGTGGAPGSRWGRSFSDQDFDRLMRETEERMRKLEEEMRKGFGNAGPAFGPQWFGPVDRNFIKRLDPRGSELRVRTDGGELRESARGARLQLTEKATDDVSKSTVIEGKSVDSILAAYPELAASPVVKALLAKRAEETAARAEREKAAGGPSGTGEVHAVNRSVTVTSQDGRTTVTITEDGPDGKPVTKTYDGADLESIKREHPEAAEALGGIRLFVGPGSGPKDRGFEPLSPEEFGAVPETGPFGLAMGPVDDELRQHLKLESTRGAVVAAVRPGSRADKLGLRLRDVIVSINGTTVDGPDQVAERVRAAGETGPLAFDVIRDGQPLTLRR